MIMVTSCAYSAGWHRRCGHGTSAAKAARYSSLMVASMGVSTMPGATVLTRMPYLGEIPGGGDGKSDDASLGGGVGGLADLSLEGRHGRNVAA
jgi:hypothetical protein